MRVMHVQFYCVSFILFSTNPSN